MSYDPYDAWLDEARGEYEAEIGARYLKEYGYELLPEHYEEAIKEFTAERLQSYYLAHPNLALPAFESLAYAQSLVPTHPKAALVFATSAVELAIKSVLLKPIVFGLVHTEVLATYITELTTKHTRVLETFHDLLTAILTEFGGVDLKTFKRTGSTKTLWQEAEEVQRARNHVIHRGASPDAAVAVLGIPVAATLLSQILPQVLRKLDLHLHDSGVICNQKHTTKLPVVFTISGQPIGSKCYVEVTCPKLDFNNPPLSVSGELSGRVDEDDLAALRSASADTYMQIISVPLRYQVQFEPDSTKFTGTKVAWS